MATTNCYREALDRANARKVLLHQSLVHNVRALMLKGILQGRTSFTCRYINDSICVDGIEVLGSDYVGTDVFEQVMRAVPSALCEVLGSYVIARFIDDVFVISTEAHEKQCRELGIASIFEDGTVFTGNLDNDPDAPTVILEKVAEQIAPEHADEFFGTAEKKHTLEEIGAELANRPSRMSFARAAEKSDENATSQAEAASDIQDTGSIQLKFDVDGLVCRTQISATPSERQAIREALLRGQEICVGINAKEFKVL